MSCRNDVSGLSVCDDRRPGSNILETQRNPGTYETFADRGEPVLSVSPEEQDFLEDLIDKDEEKIVRLSEVTLDEEKKILSAKGPLRKYVKQIVKKKIRLCYVMIEKELFGQKRKILIGIRTGEKK